jgi:hypothetical protein
MEQKEWSFLMFRTAELYLNGCLVGRIEVQQLMGAWAFGRFIPTGAFAAFRAVYDQWAQLMHRGSDAPLDQATALALAEVEYRMDRIHGQLLLEDGKWRGIIQLNIDGDLIEWEERDVVTATERRLADLPERVAQADSARAGPSVN